MKGTYRAPGFHWSARALALLGRDSDLSVARRLGVSKSTVNLKRLELGIASRHQKPSPVRWSATMLRLLGEVTDVGIARRYRMTKSTVKRKRDALGIGPPFTPRAVARTRAPLEILKLPNPEVLGRYGISQSTLSTLRGELGVPAPHVPDLRWTKVRLARLGKVIDRELALESGFDEHFTKPVDIQQLRRLFASLCMPVP